MRFRVAFFLNNILIKHKFFDASKVKMQVIDNISQFFNRIKWFLCLFLIFVSVNLNAQFYSHAINTTVAIPKEISNKAFSITYKGVAKVEFDYKIFIAKNLFVGPGINYTRWQVDRLYIPQLKSSMLNCFGSEIKIHYQYEINERKFLYVSTGFILNKQFYTNVIDTTLSKKSYNTIYASFEPKIGILLFAQPNFAVDFNASFMFTALNFNPKYTGFDKEYSYLFPKQINGNLNYFNLGIGIFVGFKGKRYADAQFPQFEDMPDNVLLPEQENQ